jgi:hypothetical protein
LRRPAQRNLAPAQGQPVPTAPIPSRGPAAWLAVLLGGPDTSSVTPAAASTTTDEDFLTAPDPEHALWLDVATIATSPLLPPELEVHGFRYDVQTGRLS